MSGRNDGEADGSYVFNSAAGLHYWHTPDNSENQLVRDGPKDQELTVQDLYNLLLHTTSTHAPQEFGTYPWKDRDLPDWNIMPDGTTSATIIELMRNMLVREDKDDLHLFSAVSPAWLQPGKSIEISNEPTVFGPVSADLKVTSGGWTVNLSNHFWKAPARVIIPIPWFYRVDHAEADGQPVAAQHGELILSANTKELDVKAAIGLATPAMSFDVTVREYKQQYKQRYEQFLRTGGNP